MSRPIKVAHVSTVDSTLRFLLLAQLKRLRDEGFEVVAISAPGPWVRDLEREGIRHVAWGHATRSWAPSRDVRGFGELLSILRRERFDVVHTHNPKPGILGRLAAKVAGVPCIANTVHGFYATPDDPFRKRVAVMGLEWLAARCSDLELYQSGEDLAWARRWRIVDPPASILLGNGTDLSQFDPARMDAERLADVRRDLAIGPGELVVGTVGRMVAEKGYREFFAAAEEIRGRHPEVRFLVVGEPDPEKADSISEEEIARAKEHVTFAGWRTDVPEMLALMDIFVLASWREGVPRSAIEAAAMGLPMVLTEIRGCREVVADGVDGLLVPPRHPQRLTTAIRRLVEDPRLRDKLGREARRKALIRFDERRVAEAVVTSTRALLQKRGLPSAARPARSRDQGSDTRRDEGSRHRG